jgi:hypothetical protein
MYESFVLALTDGLFWAWFVYPLLCWCRCPEIRTSSVDRAQLSRHYLKTETKSSLRNVAFLYKNRTMDNVQKHNICITVPSSQTFRSTILATKRFQCRNKSELSVMFSNFLSSQSVSEAQKAHAGAESGLMLYR